MRDGEGKAPPKGSADAEVEEAHFIALGQASCNVDFTHVRTSITVGFWVKG